MMALAVDDNKPKMFTREISITLLNQAGQDTIQEIAQRAQEIFMALKGSQLPNGTVTGYRNAQEKVLKLKESLKTIEQLFKKLRVIYNESENRVTDTDPDLPNLVPLVKDREDQEKPPKSTKEQGLENRKRDLEEQLKKKNKQIEALMTQMRTLVLEANAVLSSVDSC